MIKVGLIAILVIFLALMLQKERPEQSLLILLTGGVVLFGYSLARISQVMEFIQEIAQNLPIDISFLIPLIKMLGIAYMAEFASAICKDAGQQSIASQVELFAKLSIVVLSLPGLTYLMELLQSIL